MNSPDAKSSDYMDSQSVRTPPTSILDTWDVPVFSVPRAGEKFIIYQKNTNKAIMNINGEPVLQEVFDHKDKRTHWFCVDKDNYIGFQNIESFRFLGHNGKECVVLKAQKLDAWELMMPKHHHEGGYQLLSPYYSSAMMVLDIAKDGVHLERKSRGDTLWTFVEV